MTQANAETRNGWGPAAPATTGSSEEPDTGAYEDEAAEEIGGEETARHNGSGRRVYTGERSVDGEDARAEQQQEEDKGSGDWGAADAEQASAGVQERAEHDTSAGEEIDEEDEEVEEFGHPPPAEPAEVQGSDEPEGDAGEDGEEEFSPVQPEPEASQQTSTHPQPEQIGESSNGKKNSAAPREPREPRQPASEPHQREEQQPEEPVRQPQPPQQEPSPEQREQRAFDPDSPSRADVAQEHSPQPASYGAFGAGRFRRSVASSLGRLPAIGKLFGSSRTNASGRHDGARGASSSVAAREGHSSGAGSSPMGEDQGIAAKPSPQEVERRLELALRETSIDGYSKIAVGSPKGGVGKSSLAYAMGCAIANHTNIRVCLVDADPEFGATRSLVPRPVPYSIVDLARDADELQRLSDIRGYVAQNEQMRLDVVLNPSEMIQKASIGDLPTAYERIDDALSRFYDLVIYDMGIGFSHPQIQKILSLSDELLLVGDSEVVPNDIFADALSYIQGLEFGLDHATLAISHRLPPTDESATTGLVKSEHAKKLRRVTEVPYDAAFSQLLNRRAFRVDALSLQTRLGILTTAAASLEGLRSNTNTRKKGA